jgi:GT2 family glycosyltransferase
MQLSIIIINYNTFALTCKCIESILDKCVDVDYEIVLVDNASVECNADLFKEKYPEITLVKNKINNGFAGGNNSGIEHATGDYILLLNSDTELINNAPAIVLSYLKNNPEVGIASAQLQYPDGKIQACARRFRTISWELLEIFPVYKLLNKQKQGELMLHHYFNHQTDVEADWVWGTFMLFSKNILQKLPKKKLNDTFFMYCEDVLWCWEVKQLGYKIMYLPEAKVMHIHKASTSKEKLLQVRKMGIKNHATVMKKYYPDVRWHIWASIYYTKQYAALWLGK